MTLKWCIERGPATPTPTPCPADPALKRYATTATGRRHETGSYRVRRQPLSAGPRWRCAVSSPKSQRRSGEKKQEADMDIQPVLQWVEMQSRPPWEEVAPLSTATKGLWAKFQALRLTEGVLQRAWKDPATGELRWQLVVPRAERLTVLKVVHGATGAGHFGVTKTLRRLRQSFYWGQFRRDVEDFCRRCDSCTAKKGPPEQSHAQLQQFPVGAPMERVGVDIVSPLAVTDSGNRYVLSVMDYFTKWPEAYALPDQEAETVAEALLEGMVCRFGTPQTIPGAKL